MKARRDAIGFFLLAIVLYLPGIRWGLPFATAANRTHPWGQDELGPLGPLAELYSVFVAPGPTDFNPQYPLLHYMVTAVFCGPYALWLLLTGGFTKPSVTYPFGLADPVGSLATLTLLARVPSLLMGAGVVAIACDTAGRFWNRTAGILAGIAVMLSYPMFYYSRTSNVDMGALFWTALGLAVYASCLLDGLTRRRAAWLGCVAALATATRDPSYAFFAAMLPVLVGIQVSRVRRGETGRWDATSELAIGAGVASCVYVVASGLTFSLDRFIDHLDFITRGTLTSVAYVGVESSWKPGKLATKTLLSLIDALGAPAAAAAAGGVLFCLLRDRIRGLLLLPALGFWLGAIAPTYLVLFRFVTVIAYVLALFAGYVAAAGLRARSLHVRGAAWIGIVISCVWGGLRWADFTYQMIHDTRYEVADWLRRNMIPGDELGYYAAALKLPHLDPGIVARPMSGSVAYREIGVAGEEPPGFVAVIPQQEWELDEGEFPPEMFEDLMDGSLGYRQMLAIRTHSLLGHRIVSFVNPPVRLFVRKDLLPRLADREPRIELPDPCRGSRPCTLNR